MTNSEGTSDETYTPKVDQQDGGPGSHTEGDSGGEKNDVASGGVSSEAQDGGDGGQDSGEQSSTGEPAVETDVHGEPDQVS